MSDIISPEEGDPDTVIINRIKEPWKLLVLDMDIAMALAPLCSAGFFLKHEIIGLALTVFVAYKWQGARNNSPPGAAARWVWWHTPDWFWTMFTHISPPSHKREFIG